MIYRKTVGAYNLILVHYYYTSLFAQQSVVTNTNNIVNIVCAVNYIPVIL